MHVSLHNHVLYDPRLCCENSFLRSQRLGVARQKNTFALATGFGLHNESSVALLIYLRQEFFEIGWQVISCGKKIVVIWEH